MFNQAVGAAGSVGQDGVGVDAEMVIDRGRDVRFSRPRASGQTDKSSTTDAKST